MISKASQFTLYGSQSKIELRAAGEENFGALGTLDAGPYGHRTLGHSDTGRRAIGTLDAGSHTLDAGP